MSFGFPSSFSHGLPLNNLTKNQFISTVIEISKKLNWELIEITDNELLLETINILNTWNETIHVLIEKDAAYLTSSSNGNQIYDRGRNKKNLEAFLEVFYETEDQTQNTEFIENSFSEKNIISTKNNLIDKNPEVKKITSFYSFFSIFIPTTDYFVTPILININILYFLIMSFSGVNPFSPEINDIIDWGGNYGPLTIENNWWRLFSSCFVHIGIFHLLMNCYALAYIGLLIEPILKRRGFLITYVLAGILASLCSLYWNNNVVSAGASGAIFGMYGILLPAILYGVIDKKVNLNLLSSMIVFIIINVLNSFKEGVDGAAHIGGLGFGLIAGTIFSIMTKKRKAALILVSSFAIILSTILITVCKNSKIFIYQIMEYQTGMQDFVEMEKLALEAYHDDSETKEHILYMIKDRGIYYWEENITLLNNLDRLSLPETLHDQNKNLINYCKLRIKSYSLSYKKINENSNEYDSDIEALNERINELLLLIKSNSEKQTE